MILRVSQQSGALNILCDLFSDKLFYNGVLKE